VQSQYLLELHVGCERVKQENCLDLMSLGCAGCCELCDEASHIDSVVVEQEIQVLEMPLLGTG
jgi:hypothetical protein